MAEHLEYVTEFLQRLLSMREIKREMDESGMTFDEIHKHYEKIAQSIADSDVTFIKRNIIHKEDLIK